VKEDSIKKISEPDPNSVLSPEVTDYVSATRVHQQKHVDARATYAQVQVKHNEV